MKSLFAYMKDYKKECVLGPLFKLLEASFELLVPLVMAAVIDVGIANGDRELYWAHVPGDGRPGRRGAGVLHYGPVFCRKGLGGRCGQAAPRLCLPTFRSLSFTEMDTAGTSTLITRMTSDINQVQNGLNLALRLLLRSPFVVFGAMVMAFTIDVPAALVFVVAIPLLAVVVFGVMLWTMPRYKKVQAGLDRVLGDHPGEPDRRAGHPGLWPGGGGDRPV